MAPTGMPTVTSTVGPTGESLTAASTGVWTVTCTEVGTVISTGQQTAISARAQSVTSTEVQIVMYDGGQTAISTEAGAMLLTVTPTGRWIAETSLEVQDRKV